MTLEETAFAYGQECRKSKSWPSPGTLDHVLNEFLRADHPAAQASQGEITRFRVAFEQGWDSKPKGKK